MIHSIECVLRQVFIIWYSKTKADIEKELQTNIETGLTDHEAENRLKHFGPNLLVGKKPKSLLQRIFAQINSMLIYVLFAAAVISFIVGERADAYIILLVVILNAAVGVIQESKAEKALDELKRISTSKALVKRNGVSKEIPSEAVVPGDIIIIDAGRITPCDIRLVESANLKMEESALTGESLPVDKSIQPMSQNKVGIGDQKNMIFMSTIATYGRGVGIAVNSGMDTEIGKIASMLDNVQESQTPLQKALEKIGKVLAICAVAICGIIFLTGMLQGRDMMDMFMLSISLAVAAIPEGLPAIVSIVLAVGVQRMIKQNVIIRKLPAVESLGAVTIICSDKTGTLTQNKMTVTDYYFDQKITTEQPPKLMLQNMVLCNDSTYSLDAQTGDPTEIALLAAADHHGIKIDEVNQLYARVNEQPFDSNRKLMSTVNDYEDGYQIMTKGAVDQLVPKCTHILLDGQIKELNETDKNAIHDAVATMSERALRVLAYAYKPTDTAQIPEKEIEKNLIFLGLTGMIDPPRPEVRKAIRNCKDAGIQTKMITGDHKLTAFSIAKELGLASDLSEVMEGSSIDLLSEAEFSEQITGIKVFARVSPEHKVKIVQTLQIQGHIVSMTGDGVNDAPSLKRADIGVAMGVTGTDVAKGASDMILTNDNFASIERAVEEGRNIYKNIQKAVMFLLSCNLGEIIALLTAILLGWATPLRPIHILWVNLITDSLPALSLGVDTKNKNVMKEKPRLPKDSIFKGNWVSLLLNGCLIGILTLTAFVLGANMNHGSDNWFMLNPKELSDSGLIHAQTMAFVVLSFSQLMHSFNIHAGSQSLFTVGFFSNKFLLYSAMIGISIQVVIIIFGPLAAVFTVTQLTTNEWLTAIGLSVFPIILHEIVKGIRKLISRTQ